MAFSYLNNNHIKFNNNSCWCASNRSDYRKYVLIETLIRERITHKLIKNKDFFMFNINIDIRKKSNQISVLINFRYQLAYKKIKTEDIVNTVVGWLTQIKKRFEIESIDCKAVIGTGDKSAFCFAQVLAAEMSKYVSNRRIKMVAKSSISHKALGYIIMLAGRINGNSIARHDKIQKGVISRNTFKYDIEFAKFTFVGKSGCVGIKVWINRGFLPTREQVALDVLSAEE